MPSRTFTARGIRALSLWGAGLLTACGACGAIQDQYRQQITEELLQAGTGRASDAGGLPHVRIQLGVELLETMAESVARLSPFRQVRLQRRSGTDEASPTFLIRAQYSLRDVELARTGDSPAIRIQIDVLGESSVERVVAADLADIVGTASVLAPLALSEDAGAVVLDIDLRAASIEELAVSPALERPEDAAFVTEALRGDLLRQLDEASDRIELLRVPAIGEGRGRVMLAAIAFGSGDGAYDGLTLEFVSNLRPVESGLPEERPLQDAQAYRVEMVDGLPMALAEHLLAGAIIPRGYTLPSGDDVYYVLNPSDVQPNGVGVELARYCLGPSNCSIDADQWAYRWQAAGPLGVELSAEPVDGTVSDETSLAFMRSLEPALGALMSPPALVLADGQILRLRTDRIVRAAGLIGVEGHVGATVAPGLLQ
jgi:hypothetical protein